MVSVASSMASCPKQENAGLPPLSTLCHEVWLIVSKTSSRASPSTRAMISGVVSCSVNADRERLDALRCSMRAAYESSSQSPASPHIFLQPTAAVTSILIASPHFTSECSRTITTNERRKESLILPRGTFKEHSTRRNILLATSTSQLKDESFRHLTFMQDRD